MIFPHTFSKYEILLNSPENRLLKDTATYVIAQEKQVKQYAQVFRREEHMTNTTQRGKGDLASSRVNQGMNESERLHLETEA